MIEIVDLLGGKYLATECSESDIQVHYETIRNIVEDEDEDEFKSRMLQCVNEGTAYALIDGSCFIYYLKDKGKPKISTGVALYGEGSPLALLALFSYVFTAVDSKAHLMMLNPHSEKFIIECKSLMTLGSIIKYRMGNHPLMVRIDLIKAKVLALKSKREI